MEKTEDPALDVQYLRDAPTGKLLRVWRIGRNSLFVLVEWKIGCSMRLLMWLLHGEGSCYGMAHSTGEASRAVLLSIDKDVEA